ncbi:cytochrome c biogenesis CcdA family protein [Streptomyces inhibens]|uniref:cytochrome c biogenesis CcdA family protein n=1 Tax=Streptomyces inhibens TaxID=2293571 RepID=UPI00402A993A
MSSIQSTVTDGPLLLAMPIAAAAGIASFLSPCVLPLVPGYLSYVTGMTGMENGRDKAHPRRYALIGTSLFVLGFSFVFASFGTAFGFLGNKFLDHQEGISQILGTLTILMGLTFLGLFERFIWTGRTFRMSWKPRVGLIGAPVLGFMFGVSWTPCIGPTLTSVLGMSMSTGNVWRGAWLAFVYSAGIGIPFILASLAIGRVAKALEFARRHTRVITRIGGLLLVAVGVLEVTGVWNDLVHSLQAWTASYEPPL